jgi:PTS system glucitol/sorbitol-specific IIA component
MIKYQATITAIGPYVAEFIDHNILVFFGDQAPEELAEFSILHDGKELKGSLSVGDTVCLGESSFTVLAVGDVANDNLRNLGHVIIRFNGEAEPEMPGDVCVEKKPLPEIEPGLEFRIEEGK